MGGSGLSYYNWLGQETCINTVKGFSSGGLSAAVSEGKKAMAYYASMSKYYYKDTYGRWNVPIDIGVSVLSAVATSDYMKGQYVSMAGR